MEIKNLKTKKYDYLLNQNKDYIMEINRNLTGYSSTDKPWLKYYSEEVVNASLPECTLYEYLLENNKHRLECTALNYFNRKISYADLFRNIERTAKGFTSIGVKNGDIVTVFGTNTPELIYCIYALNYIGAIANMEYITESKKEALDAINRCNSSVVVILDSLLPKFSNIINSDTVKTVVVISLDGSMPHIKKLAHRVKTAKTSKLNYEKVLPFYRMIYEAEAENCTRFSYIKNSPAVIVHSGGTTGIPKGVVLSNDNLIYIVWAFQNNGVNFKPNDKYLYEIPPFHSFGMAMGICCSLCIGMETILAVKFDDVEACTLFAQNKPNHFMGSGAQIPSLLSDKRIQKMDLSFFHTCGFGGTPLTIPKENELLAFLENRSAPSKPNVGYGMSETSSAICTELNRYYGKTGSVGIPLPKANVMVLDIDTGKELEYGIDGELCFSSPGLMLKYFENEKETLAAIFTGKDGARWIHSGDVGHVDEDGFVFITGRIKRIYSTRSEKNGTLYKIFPDYVTNVIDEVDNVKESAVVCIEDPDYNYIGVAYVVLKNNADKEQTDLKIREHLQSVLPMHSIPKHVRYIDALPLTLVGKIDYMALENETRKLQK